ncbi:D-alanyl-D-alanine carboxypeptidase/D-alanyl-D-alanine-endopeptidase [Crocosphaera sp. UHCC 0190]|uniref:D-alanyl-D-alanine carboxypeptidase/D-alanyl-D-alanine endopeptidase n=1 Tax=Crocosphaera sp. UHCC 0190 TaxID=3110246 RepID=UPI002B208425|nr:D-alanyl-D-alanine carboxypeptidase/D-alanyl-D-alanine-endopeptidase [Crocosphaera sp. UHCC 0190]MEA5508275.1 D-alanyl-D-alanine carboxypeptidase/D-alanyl-D-alanine-endopeptidase [Crocosphaera sp. UHCC 0190]
MNSLFFQLIFFRQFCSLWSLLLILLTAQFSQISLAFENNNSASKLIPQKSSEKFCKAHLKTRIDQLIEEEIVKRSPWGILVKTLDNNETLYEINSQKFFIPASNIKLFTTAAALVKFGPDFQINTPIYAQGTAPNLRVLKLVGNGDPTLQTEQLKQLATTLKKQGIRRIEQLIVEDNQRNITPINLTWEWEDIQFYYATAVNRLILNENTVTLTLTPQEIDEPLQLEWSDLIAGQQWQINNQTLTASQNTPYSITIQRNFAQPLLTITGKLAINSQPDTFGLAVVDPADYFLDSLQNALETEEIIITKSSIITQTDTEEKSRKLTTIKSPSLATIITKANENSNNLYAESLLNLFASNTSEITPIENLQETLKTLGLEPELYQLKDGSGLSRHNLATPEAFVTLLSLILKTSEGDIYRNSLPVAGKSGTLKKRFQDTIIEGRMAAKTGTLSGISALSGYLDPPNYSPLVFSILVNQSNLSPSQLREVIDQIVLTLGELKRC